MEFRICDKCGSLTNKILCDCYGKRIGLELEKFLNAGRKKNNIIIFNTPYSKLRGMSEIRNHNIDKFIKFKNTGKSSYMINILNYLNQSIPKSIPTKK